MNKMLLKGVGLPSILLVGGVALLSACSQKSEFICGLSDPGCEIPSPPREHTNATVQKETAIPSQLPPSSNTIENSDHQLSPQLPSNSAKQITKVQVIEHIRKPTSVVRTQLIYNPSVAQTKNKVQPPVTVPNFTSNTVYTIQLGAYKKISSRNHAINQFPDDSELLLFTMRNDLLGLSYGQYETLSEAKAKRSWLLEQGITDFVFRRLPRNAQPLN